MHFEQIHQCSGGRGRGDFNILITWYI